MHTIHDTIEFLTLNLGTEVVYLLFLGGHTLYVSNECESGLSCLSILITLGGKLFQTYTAVLGKNISSNRGGITATEDRSCGPTSLTLKT